MIANIIRSRSKTAIGGGGGGIVIDNGDPFYSAVSMLLPMDGADGSTTFTDASSNAIALTATGSPQISTSQSKFGGASTLFPTNQSYLTAPSSSLWAFGTGDFTVEFWIYIASNQNSQGIIGNRPNVSSATTWQILFWTTNNRIEFHSGAAVVLQSTSTVSLNTWTHVAFCRSSGTLRVFLNGVQAGSVANANNFSTEAALNIGRDLNAYASSNGIVGNMDDLRISRFARYVSNFTPPTAALPTTASSTPADPYYGYTSLLLHMDGSNASTNFVDSGPNAFTLTRYGTAAVSTTQSKFGGASAYFDGSGAKLGLSSTAIDFGTGDFTAECWLYLISTPTGAYAHVMGKQVGGVSASWILYINTSRVLLFGWNNTNQLIQSPSALNLSQWYHLAVSRSGSTIRMFIDGTQVSSTTISYTFSSSTEFTVGAASNDYTPARLNAYVDDLRITKYARYTSAFAPPTQALPEYATGNDRYFTNTSLLLHMDGANGSTTFTDNSANARTITAVGNAQISTAQSQFGSSSAYFDGTGDYLSFTGGMPSGTGTAFTLECWIRLDDLSAYRAITRTAGGLDIGVQPNGIINCDQTSVGIIANSATGVITAGTWYHIAVTRDTSSNYKIYVNGTQVASGTNSFSVTAATTIGFSAFSGAHYFKGYIDDFRATNVLRYTSNFTPPTSAHPNA